MTLYCWGANNSGQLGLGYKSEAEIKPKEVNLDGTGLDASNIAAIAGGSGHTLILDSSGQVFSSGSNSQGQLGQNVESMRFEQVDILKEYRVVQVACGWDFSAAVSACGKLFVWGNNRYTQLGLGKSITCTGIPSRLQVSQKLATGFQQISCGLRHIAVVTKEGGVLVAGSGSKGQLGLGDHYDDNSYLSISKVPDLEDMRCVSAGENHTLALRSDGAVFSWGDNKHGQLGLSPDTPKCTTPKAVLVDPAIDKVYSGWSHSAALTNSGQVYVWGRNSYGQLGTQRAESFQPELLESLKDVAQLSLGSEHTMALTREGKLYAWGWNEHGSCATGSTENVLVPRQILEGCPKVRIAAACNGHSFAVVE